MSSVPSMVAKDNKADVEESTIDAPGEDQLHPDKILNEDNNNGDSDDGSNYFMDGDIDPAMRRFCSSNWAQKWTEDEDIRLIEGIERFGEGNWRQVASMVGTRDAVKCMQRWEKGLRPGIVKGRWSEDEDRMLVFLVSQGHKNWGKVAAHMPGRTSKQCRERWNNYLDPTLIHTPFTEEEDELLLKLQTEYGNKWALISRNIAGRTENAVKLRYHALQKRTGGATSLPSANSAAVSRQRLMEASMAAQDVLMNKRQRLDDSDMYAQDLNVPLNSLSAELNKNSFIPSGMTMEPIGIPSSSMGSAKGTGNNPTAVALPISAAPLTVGGNMLPSNPPFTDPLTQMLANQQQLSMLDNDIDRIAAMQQSLKQSNSVNVIPNPAAGSHDVHATRNLQGIPPMNAMIGSNGKKDFMSATLEAAIQQQQQQQQHRTDFNALHMLNGLNNNNNNNSMNMGNNMNMSNKFMGFPQMNSMGINNGGGGGGMQPALNALSYQQMAMHNLAGNNQLQHMSGLSDAMALQNARALQNLRALQNFQNIQNLHTMNAFSNNRMPSEILLNSLQHAPPIPMMSGLMNLPPAFLQQQLQQQQLHALNPLMAMNPSQHDIDQQELNDSDNES